MSAIRRLEIFTSAGTRQKLDHAIARRIRRGPISRLRPSPTAKSVMLPLREPGDALSSPAARDGLRGNPAQTGRAGTVLRRQRDKLPLLAELIAETQPSADEEMARRAEHWPQLQQKEWDDRAGHWRRARKHLFEYDLPRRAAIRSIWQGRPYPADPVYLLDLLHQIDMGKMDPHRPPWIYFQPVAEPVTPDATRFEDAFSQIGHKKVGGGPKTNAADEFLFCGNLGSGMLILRSRVRLLEPNESFYTCSAHRLRDSHVGRQGHWVDLRVRGGCSDADLALITRLAQEADTQPVIVSREKTCQL